jgi:hypothetical protein
MNCSFLFGALIAAAIVVPIQTTHVQHLWTLSVAHESQQPVSDLVLVLLHFLRRCHQIIILDHFLFFFGIILRNDALAAEEQPTGPAY